jgi:hypothetical protein
MKKRASLLLLLLPLLTLLLVATGSPRVVFAADQAPPKTAEVAAGAPAFKEIQIAEKDRIAIRELQLQIVRSAQQRATLESQYRALEGAEKAAQGQLDALVESVRPKQCADCLLRDSDLKWFRPPVEDGKAAVVPDQAKKESKK